MYGWIEKGILPQSVSAQHWLYHSLFFGLYRGLKNMENSELLYNSA